MSFLFVLLEDECISANSRDLIENCVHHGLDTGYSDHFTCDSCVVFRIGQNPWTRTIPDPPFVPVSISLLAVSRCPRGPVVVAPRPALTAPRHPLCRRACRVQNSFLVIVPKPFPNQLETIQFPNYAMVLGNAKTRGRA